MLYCCLLSLFLVFFHLSVSCLLVQLRKIGSLPVEWTRVHEFDEYRHLPPENYCYNDYRKDSQEHDIREDIRESVIEKSPNRYYSRFPFLSSTVKLITDAGAFLPFYRVKYKDGNTVEETPISFSEAYPARSWKRLRKRSHSELLLYNDGGNVVNRQRSLSSHNQNSLPSSTSINSLSKSLSITSTNSPDWNEDSSLYCDDGVPWPKKKQNTEDSSTNFRGYRSIAFTFMVMDRIEFEEEWEHFFVPKYKDFFKLYIHQAKKSSVKAEWRYTPNGSDERAKSEKSESKENMYEKSKPDTKRGSFQRFIVPRQDSIESDPRNWMDTKNSDDTSYPEEPTLFFKGNIPYTITELFYSAWCRLLGVQIGILRRAYQDKSNKYFVVVSQNHVPLVPFPQYFQRIFSDERSRICFGGRAGLDVPASCSYATWANWGGRYILKHHQWLVLNRGHTRKLSTSFTQEVFSRFYEKFTFEPMCSDEVVPILTLLEGQIPPFHSFQDILENLGIKEECTTFSFWSGCLYQERRILQRFVIGQENDQGQVEKLKAKERNPRQKQKVQIKGTSRLLLENVKSEDIKPSSNGGQGLSKKELSRFEKILEKGLTMVRLDNDTVLDKVHNILYCNATSVTDTAESEEDDLTEEETEHLSRSGGTTSALNANTGGGLLLQGIKLWDREVPREVAPDSKTGFASSSKLSTGSSRIEGSTEKKTIRETINKPIIWEYPGGKSHKEVQNMTLYQMYNLTGGLYNATKLWFLVKTTMSDDRKKAIKKAKKAKMDSSSEDLSAELNREDIELTTVSDYYFNKMKILWRNSLLKSKILAGAGSGVSGSDDLGAVGVKKDTHPGSLVIRDKMRPEFSKALAESGYLMARKVGRLPMVSFIPREKQLEIEGGDAFLEGIGMKHLVYDATSSDSTKKTKDALLPPPGLSYLNRRMCLLAGYPKRFDLLEDSHLQYYYAYFLLLSWDVIEPFRVYCLLVLATWLLGKAVLRLGRRRANNEGEHGSRSEDSTGTDTVRPTKYGNSQEPDFTALRQADFEFGVDDLDRDETADPFDDSLPGDSLPANATTPIKSATLCVGTTETGFATLPQNTSFGTFSSADSADRTRIRGTTPKNARSTMIFFCTLLVLLELYKLLASLLKLEGRDWFLTRMEYEDL